MEFMISNFSTSFELFINENGMTIIVLALFLSSLSPQAMAFRITELVFITVSLFDVFITGNAVSAIVLAILLGPCIPLAYVGIICALLSAADHLATGGIYSIIVTAVLGVCILLRSGESVTFSIPFSGISINKVFSTPSKMRRLATVCFTFLWLVRGVAYVAPDTWKDEFRFVDNLYGFSQEVERYTNSSAEQAETSSESEYYQEGKDRIYIYDKNPQNSNFFDKYLHSVSKKNIIKSKT